MIPPIPVHCCRGQTQANMSSPKIVVITGANTGIGYETVKALVQSDQAYRIFVGSRSVEKGEAAIETLRREFPQSTSTLEVLQVDVSTDESIQHAFETVKAKTEYIDVLINNAGMPQTAPQCRHSVY